MGSFKIVEVEVAPHPLFECGDRLIAPKVDVLVLERAPESLNEDVVEIASAAIHTDSDAGVG